MSSPVVGGIFPVKAVIEEQCHLQVAAVGGVRKKLDLYVVIVIPQHPLAGSRYLGQAVALPVSGEIGICPPVAGRQFV